MERSRRIPYRDYWARRAFGSRLPWLLGIELRDRDPGDLLAILVADCGWAYAGDLSRLYRGWVGPPRGRLDATTLAGLDGALRAALDF